MTKYSTELNVKFQALADPTRRTVLEKLSLGPATVSQLAEPFKMALPSFLQHLKVLEQSKLVRSYKTGRVRTFELQVDELRQAQHWLKAQEQLWERRLDQLDNYLITLAQEEKNHDTERPL